MSDRDLDMEPPKWIAPGFTLVDDDGAGVEDGDSESGFVSNRFGAFVFLVSGALVFMLVAFMFLREFYSRKYGVDICRSCISSTPRRRSQSSEEVARDREMAEELQRTLNDEEREVDRVAKRKERRAWYESYIKPFTMTASAIDFFYAHEIDGEMTIHEPTPTLKRMSTTTSDDECEDIDDLERGLHGTERSCIPILCEETESDAHLYLRLPVKNAKGCQQTVDAHCAICFSEYEEGDTLVWSGLECQHAFHDQCILPWLSKGKKRCPICRHWFVPGARIDEQRKELEARLQEESLGSNSETSDETDSSQGGDSASEACTESDESGSDTTRNLELSHPVLECEDLESGDRTQSEPTTCPFTADVETDSAKNHADDAEPKIDEATLYDPNQA